MRTIHSPSKAFTFASFAALIVGVAAYLVGLFNATMQLNEKGYYLTVLLFSLFAAVAVQKSVRDNIEGVPVTRAFYLMSWAALLCAIGLFSTGLYNAELLLSEKGFYAMAYTLALFAAVTAQKNIRDKAATCAEESSHEHLDTSAEQVYQPPHAE